MELNQHERNGVCFLIPFLLACLFFFWAVLKHKPVETKTRTIIKPMLVMPVSGKEERS